MKKFSFSLQTILNYKEQLFDIERTVLADMRAILEKMKEELQILREDHKNRTNLFNQKAAEGTTAQDMELQKMYLRIVENNIEQKHLQIKLQNKAIEKQMEKVKEAKLEISSMEKLKERKLEEYRYMEAKANDAFVEEFVSNQRATNSDEEK